MLSRRSMLGVCAAPALRGQALFGDAEAYERFMGRWSRLLAPGLIGLAGVHASGRFLDVGSGTGSLSFAIAESIAGCSVTGIDPSKEYVAFATSRNRFPQRVRFEVGDALALRFPEAAFHASLSLLVFNFIPDAARALSEVRRVTAPGGSVTAAVWDYGDGMRMLRLFWQAAGAVDPAARQRDEAHMRLCRPGELPALWKRGGLQQVVEQPLEITMRFQSFAGYWEPFLQGQGPAGAYVRGARGELREAVRRELVRLLGVRSEADPFSLPARAWAVRGVVPSEAAGFLKRPRLRSSASTMSGA